MAAGRPKSIDNSKIFDVSKPGKSKPMGTSRPVIISHGNIMKDPTVVPVQSESSPEVPAEAPSASRKVISPVSSDMADTKKDSSSGILVKVNGAGSKSLEESMIEGQAVSGTEVEVKNTAPTVEPTEDDATGTVPPSAEPAEQATEEQKTEETAAIDTSSEPPAESEDEAPTTDTDTTDSEYADTESEDDAPVTSDAAAVDALAESTTKKKEAEKELEEEAKHEAELQGLVDSQKYFVPLEHDSSAHKSNKRALVILIMILIIGAAYVVIDAKVVKTGLSLPFHLFKQ